MEIIACLGNPGDKYRKNRHNAGCIIGEYLAREFNISITRKAFSSNCGRGRIVNVDVLILMPQTYMNNSGLAIKSALQYYDETPENLIVIHDEIEIPFGEYRTKFGGGHRGHNGLRSIIQHIKTPDFHRIRFGVGRPTIPKMTVANYLLSDFKNEELEHIGAISPQLIDKISNILTNQGE